MERAKQWIDRTIIGIASVLVVFLVAGAIWQVFTRFVLQNPSVFTEEVLRFSLIWVGFLGASYAFGHKEHLALTFLTSKLKKEKRMCQTWSLMAVSLLLYWSSLSLEE